MIASHYNILCKFGQYITKHMAHLIESMEDEKAPKEPEPLDQMAKNLKHVFKSNHFECKNISDNGKNLTFHIKSSKTTYRLSTIWYFNFVASPMNLQITFYNSTETELLRASTIRMRIQLAMLANIVNNQALYGNTFIVDTESGILKLISSKSWSIYQTMAPSREHIYNLINNYFHQLRRFDELMVFIQPACFNPKEVTQKDKTISAKINRFRALLKSTRNVKRQIRACLVDIVKLKQIGDQNQLQQVKQLYMKNIISFQKSAYGLEDCDPFEIREEDFIQQFKEIRKNQKGFSHQDVMSNKRLKKILFGLHKIEPYMESQQQIFSQEGAHSEIYRKKFRYVVYESIYQGTINMDGGQWEQKRRQVKGQLTYKKCKKSSQTSVNSFRNEIQALKYLKDKYSPFVAKYFMLIKESWDENDTIYMCNYRQNIHGLLKNCTSYGLKARLELSYQIAKGLCFLYANEIAHRDFKPQNIVVDGNLQPKIIDFGSAIPHHQKGRFKPYDARLLTTQGYNIQYYLIPPGNENLLKKYKKEEFDEHPLFDVYGFGRTLCYIFFNEINPPNPESFLSEPLFDVLDHIIFLINMCITVDPEDRPGYGELTSFLGALKELVKSSVHDQYSINGNTETDFMT